MSQIENNQAVWRVLLNAFPYKSASQMGLDNDLQAYAVTRQAVYRVLDGKDTSGYSGATEAGIRMANKVRELVNIGINGTQTYQEPVIMAKPITEAGIDSIDNSYISQTFIADSEVNMKNINVILNTINAPSGTRLTDANNNEKTTFNKGEQFKISVPRNNITQDINIGFSMTGQCETYPIFYGKAPSANIQNYVLTTDPFVMSTARANMEYTPTGTIEVNKISNGNSGITGIKEGEGLKGATFVVKSKDGIFEKEVITDENGQFILSDLELKEYIISEKLAPDYFLKDEETTFEVKLEYDGDKKELTVGNIPVNLIVDVEKEGPEEARQGEEITYNFSHVGNFSNVAVDNFIWGDKLPRQVRLQKISTGTWNEELNYKIEYITNKNTNWKQIGDSYNTTENKEVDFTKVELENDEYITEYRFIFGTVKKGFQELESPNATVKINENVANNKIIVNKTYVNATYEEIFLEDNDEAHTIIYKKIETSIPKGKPLPKTGE